MNGSKFMRRLDALVVSRAVAQLERDYTLVLSIN